MAKIQITIEDTDDEKLSAVKWDKDTPGPLDGGGTAAEQIAYLMLQLLMAAKYEAPLPMLPIGEGN